MFKEMTQDEIMKTDGGLVVTMGAMAVGAFVGKKVIVAVVGKTVLAKAGATTAAIIKASGATAGMTAGAGWANNR